MFALRAGEIKDFLVECSEVWMLYNKNMNMPLNETSQNKTVHLDFTGIKFSGGMHPAGFPPLTMELLENIIQRITSQLPVEKMILFGSYSNQKSLPTPDSDIDLLVIMETTQPPVERVLTISRLIRPRPFPMDILVRTPQEIAALLESGDLFFQEIMTQGKVIYERSK
jgi:uncharacterized protein